MKNIKPKSTYHKLKKENLDLKNDIYQLLRGKFMDREEVKFKWNNIFDLEQLVWRSVFGTEIWEHIDKQRDQQK